jgi:hypothetical protein
VREKIALRVKESDAIVRVYRADLPTVDEVRPDTGPHSGSTQQNPQNIRIRGTNLIGATKIMFGVSEVAVPSAYSDTEITVPLPAAAAAAVVHVKVTTVAGTSLETDHNRFTYT